MAHLTIYVCDFCDVRMDDPAGSVDLAGPMCNFGDIAWVNCQTLHACPMCARRLVLAINGIREAGMNPPPADHPLIISFSGGLDL